jgi:hypothetical protein
MTKGVSLFLRYLTSRREAVTDLYLAITSNSRVDK